MTDLLFTYRDGDRYEPDEWTSDSRRISDQATMQTIETAIEGGEIVALEHWHYRGARAPDRMIFDDFEDLTDYLSEKAFAGDAIHIFPINDALKSENKIASGKCPDAKGLVPKKGAY